MAKRRWKIEDIKSVVSGENPFKQFGYEAEKPKRKIGDRWEDSQRRIWEQKNGYQVVVNEKADVVRELLKQECSQCHKDMKWGTRLDHKFFIKSGMCYDCTINRDTMLMATGRWKDYEKKKVISYQLEYLKEARKNTKESIEYLSTTDGKMHFVDEMGGIETWTNTQIDKLLENAKGDYDRFTQDIERLEKILEDLNEQELNAK